MHISYEHDIDAFMDGTRGMLMERIMGESRLKWDGGAFALDTSPERLPEAIFNFGQALTRVYDLTLLSRSNVGSTFYDDLADLISSWVDEAKIQRDYLPEVPNAEVYPVGLPNRGQERRSAIPLRRAQPRQGAFGDDNAVLLPPARTPIRVDPRIPRSGGDSQDGPSETLGRWRRHDLVARVPRGFPSEGPAARCGVKSLRDNEDKHGG